MEITIQTPDIHVTQKIKNKISRKLENVCKLYDRITACEVTLLEEKNEEQMNCCIEIRILVPGQALFTRQRGPTFESALSKTALAMKHQLQKYKERYQNMNHLSL